jgi:hypothetical protein
MKKLFMLLLLAALPTFASAQLQIIPKPSLSLGVGGGFSAGAGDGFNQNIQNLTSSGTRGINFGAKAVFTIPAVPLRFMAHFTRHNLSQSLSGSLTGVTGTPSALDYPVNTFGVGAELVVLPLPVISPFVSLDYSFASISSPTVTVSGTTINTGSSSVSRQGIGIGVGTDLAIPGLPLSFTLDLKYRFLNMVGKETGEQSLNAAQVSVYAVYKLF